MSASFSGYLLTSLSFITLILDYSVSGLIKISCHRISYTSSYTGNFYFSFVFSLDEDGDVLGWFLIMMVGLIRINPEETISTYKGGS